MLRSMFSAISGLRAHQTKMDVVGNNIANVNTVGFKSSNTVFQDTLSQVMRAGGAPAAALGGTNPAQVGLGVKLAGISTNWTQGATQTTGRATDFMIEGDGMFVTRAGTDQLFTRAGSFDFDAQGNLVTSNGGVLQGWMANAAGVVNSNLPISDLKVPYGQTVNPQQSTIGSIIGNLPANDPVGSSVQTGITMYDAQGVAQKVFYNFTKTGANAWDLDVVHSDGTVLVNNAPIAFNAAGALTTPAAPGTIAPFTPPAATYPSWTGPVTIDVSGLSQFGGATTISAPDQNGYAQGSLQSFSLGNDGTITGIYSNGLRQSIGQLAVASFNNPSGLEKAGSSTFRVGNNSGVPQIGVAGTGGRGVLNAGALEMSNVDLAEEFTGLIVAQRGFQANSRVITSSDEMLQDLVNLKR
jgi:flagellar hook protein FlgE